VNIGQTSKIISSVLADNVTVGENCELLETKIYPHIKIADNRKYAKETLMTEN